MSMNVGLSGLDVNSIVTTAVKAKTTSMNSNIQKQIAQYNNNLSGLGQLSSYLSSFRETLTQESDNYTVTKSLTQNSDKNDTYGIDVKTTKDVSDYLSDDLDVKVKQLHENAKITHKFSMDFSNHFHSGTINFDLGGKNFSITCDTDDTLEVIRRNINENNPFGITASLINSTSGYVLTLNHSNDFTMRFDGDIAQDFENTVQSTSHAKKAIIEVNGNEIQSNSNDFDQIAGVQIHANFVSESHVQIRKDEKSLDGDIQNFVNKFNSMISAIDSLGKRNTVTDGVQNNDGGVLAGNSYLRRVKDDLKNTIGVEFMDLNLEFDKDGKLKIEDGVYGVNGELSFSEKKRMLEELFDKMKIKVDEYLDGDSFISKEKNRMNDNISDANERLTRNNAYIQKYQDTVIKKYSKLDALIQNANNNIQLINNLFSSGTN